MNFLPRGRVALAPAMALVLSGCLSLGGPPPPEVLLNLTPTAQAAAGTGASGTSDTALAIFDLQAPQKLNVTRVPVTTGDSSLAYLKDAVWVDRPTRLFGLLLSDTIRAKGNRLLVTGTDLEFQAASKLSGMLSAMDYDATRGAVVVRFDAVLQTSQGQVLTRRFESVIDGVPAQAEPVAEALNRAANQVADQVAEWVG